MMKKDGMQKPYKEEKAGLKIGLKRTSILFIVLFFSKEIFPQIPINGFCQFNNFNTEKGLSSVFPLNFNNDFYTDLLLFNSNQKKIISLAGEQNGNFSKSGVYKVPYQITSIKGLNEKDSKVKQYAFISRQNMRAGIYSFTSGGRAYLTSSVKFNSYPRNLSLADVNKNGNDEFLISGPSFDGLSIISQEGGALKEKKITAKTSFSDAVFADLSNDGYPDIAAFDILKNSLVFFYNQSQNNFKQVRTIKMDQPIHSLHAVDMNLDSYPDLLYTEGNSINIIYGDFASAYNNKATINTRFYPDQIITGDFNRDGKIDIAYLNFNEGIISIIYAKNNGGYFPEVIYLKKDGLQGIIPYYSKFINGIVSISSNGNIFTIRNLLSFSGNVNISIGAAPAAISSFDYGNNGINDLCYIDNYDSKLNLIVRNAEGIPSTFYSYQLFDNFSEILVDNFESRVKSFYCFSRDKKLIEILKIDFKSNKVEQNSIYSPGAIEDLKIKRAAGSLDNIYIAFKRGTTVGLSIMEYKDYRYSEANYYNLAGNVCSANVTFDNGPGLIYWQKTQNGATLNKVSITNGSSVSNKLFTFSEGAVSSICSFTGELFNNDRQASVSFIKAGDKNYVTVSNFKNTNVITLPAAQSLNMVYNEEQLFPGDSRPNGLKKLFVYSPDNNSVNRIDFLNKGRDISVQHLVEADNAEDYFIQKMSTRNYHLIYTDKLNNCITIKQL
ncbi:MAG: VCBS repeat-containing protein [Ignavibacteriaceae bacterium]|nr:VCBS repeat-containing protein [Ignavibacteriaceae bacterium]